MVTQLLKVFYVMLIMPSGCPIQRPASVSVYTLNN